MKSNKNKQTMKRTQTRHIVTKNIKYVRYIHNNNTHKLQKVMHLVLPSHLEPSGQVEVRSFVCLATRLVS